MPCYDKNLTPSDLSSAGFPNATQCVQSPCDERGLCCYGANGVLSSQCRCYSEPPMKGVFVPGETTCCPDCDNVGLGGGCCRETWVNDGNGACCPQECCPNGGENGGCCPPGRPYCCDGLEYLGYTNSCQAFLPTVGCESMAQYINACDTQDNEVMLSTAATEFSARIGITARPQEFVTYEVDFIIECGDASASGTILGGPSGSNSFNFEFCKAVGVTEAKVTLSTRYLAPSLPRCPSDPNQGPEWTVIFQCAAPCQCSENPLP